MWRHQHHHHAPAPRDLYPLMPQYYSNPHQLHHHHALVQPAPTGHPPHTAHYTGPHHIYYLHQPVPPFPPAPWYHTQPTHPHHQHHTVQHHVPPPLHGLATFGPSYAPKDPQRAVHAQQEHQGLQGAPHHHQQPPPPAAHASENHPPAAIRYLQTTAPRDAQATTSHLDTGGNEEPREPHNTHTQHPHNPTGRPNSHPAPHTCPLLPQPEVLPPHHYPTPLTRDQTTEAPRVDPHQPPPPAAPADTHGHESSLPRPPRETPSPDPARDNDDHPPPTHTTPLTTHSTTSRPTGRALHVSQPRSNTATPPGPRRPGGAAPPHLGHQPTHQGDHPRQGGHLGGGR